MSSKIIKITNRFNLKTLLIVAVSLSILVVFLLKISSNSTQKVAAAWFNDSWGYRQAINISSHSVGETNVYFTVSVNIGSTTKAKLNDSDFRFTDISSNILPYYISSGVGTTTITFHVFVSNFPSGPQIFYAYYGNPTASAGNSSADFSTAAGGISVGANTAEEQSLAPIGWWKFDEGYGTTFNNAGIGGTLNGVAGVSTSAPSWTDENNCISGKCLLFSGTKYLSIAHNSSISPTGNYTISFWMRPESNNPSYVILKNGEYGVRWQGNASGLNWYDNTNISGSKANWNLNQWYLITMTKSGSTITGYINGLVDLTTSGSAHTFVSAPLEVGRYSTENFGGKVDDLKVYNYARTPAQVLADFNTKGGATSKGNSALLGANRENTQTGFTGPIGYWNLDESVGSSAYDTTGNNNNGAWQGTLGSQRGNGKFGGAGFFNGTDNYINAGTSPSFSLTNNITINAWVKPTNVNSTNQLIAGWGGTGGQGYKIYLGSGNKFFFFCSTGSFSGVSTPINNNWYFVSTTIDSSNLARLYVNGILESTNPVTLSSGTGPFTIGRDPSSAAQYFYGQIDEVKVYNYARTQKQIIEDMSGNHPAAGNTTIQGNWEFTEGYGTIANNSGNAQNSNGTLSGGNGLLPVWTNNSLFGNVLTFSNGSSATYVSIPGTGGLATTTDNSFSFSTWAKPSSAPDAVTWASNILGRIGFHTTLSYITDQTFGFGIWNSGATNYWAFTGTTYPPGSWYHLIGVANDTAKTLSLYVNGKLSVGTTYTGALKNFGTANYYVGSFPMGNGLCDTGNFSWCFNGSVAQPKIYNYALTSSEVLLDYNQNQTLQLGSNTQNIGTTNSPQFCIPGDTAYCTAPAGYWNFDEGTGTTAYDSSGNNYNAGWSNTSKYAYGQVGKAGLFTAGVGVTTYVRTSSTLPVAPTAGTPFTFSMWVKSYLVNNVSQTILATSDGTGTGRTILGIRNTDNRFNSNIGNVQSDAGIVPVANVWYHISLVYNGSGETFYVNGVGTSSFTNVIEANSSMITIGANKAGAGIFNGLIDDFKYYNYARTPAQVALDYNRGAPIAWWKFDECQGSTMFDATINQNNLNWQGGTAAGTCTVPSTAWGDGANGKWNASLSFIAASSDHLNSATPYTVSSATTVSYWFKSPTISGVGNPGIITNAMTSASFWSYLLGTASGADVGKVWFHYYNAAATSYDLKSARRLDNSTWHHVVSTYDSSTNYAKLYIDGVFDSQLSTTGLLQTATGTFEIGKYPTYFSGQLDDIRIYNYPLTPTQISTLYNENAAVRFGPASGSP